MVLVGLSKALRHIMVSLRKVNNVGLELNSNKMDVSWPVFGKMEGHTDLQSFLGQTRKCIRDTM